MVKEVTINRTKYSVFIINSDVYTVSPKLDKYSEEKMRSFVWACIVAPNGPNFRGRKVKSR